MVGVGLLYRQGYFRQRLNRNGWQEDYYVDNAFPQMPLELIKNEQGEPITIEVEVRQRLVKVQIWRVQVGRVSLYLLDSDRHDNDPIDRWLTGHLYGGNKKLALPKKSSWELAE
jgi:starch phosphorylase